MNKAVKYMLISAIAFSFMNVCVKYLKDFPVTELILFRSLVSLILSFFAIWRLGLSPFGNNRQVLLLRGFFGAISLSLFFYTLQKTPISTAITIQYLSPIFTSLFAIWILNEPMNPKRWFFFAISFSGILVMKGWSDAIDIKIMFLGVVSSAFAGLAYNMIRKLKDTDHPIVVVLYFPLVSVPIMVFFSFLYWKTPVGIDWLLLILMGVFTQIAQLYMTKAWQNESANKVASLKYFGMVLALFFDFVLFDVLPPWSTFLGIFLLIFGVVLNMRFKDQ